MEGGRNRAPTITSRLTAVEENELRDFFRSVFKYGSYRRRWNSLFQKCCAIGFDMDKLKSIVTSKTRLYPPKNQFSSHSVPASENILSHHEEKLVGKDLAPMLEEALVYVHQ